MHKKVVVFGGGTGISYLLKGLKDFPIEFTPVDYLAKSIIKSIEYYGKSINILHLYNIF